MTEQKKPAAAAKSDQHSHTDLEERLAELELRAEAFDRWTAALGHVPLVLFTDAIRKERDAG